MSASSAYGGKADIPRVAFVPNPDISLAVVSAPESATSPAPCRLDRGYVDLSMPIIASNARFASSPPAASASVSTRGVICQKMPHLSLHQPHWLSWPPLPTMAFQ